MKVIVAGSRDIYNYMLVRRAINEAPFSGEITQIVSGVALGVDTLGEQWAMNNDIKIKQFPALWEEHGRSAGFRRNRKMAYYADALIAVWDGQSKGTADMIKVAAKAGLKIHVKIVTF